MKNQDQNNQPIDLSTLSAAELQAALNEKLKAERENRAAKKKKYEQERETLIEDLINDAIGVRNMLIAIKTKAMQKLPQFRAQMLEYGQLRKGDRNKGTFEIKNEHYKIIFTNHEKKAFDERAELAEERLREFLETFVKKSNQKTYRLVKSLLERNPKSGDYDITLINRLYALEEEFDDPNWKEAIRLFKESFSPTGTKQYARFFHKGANGEWVPIILDFANAKTINDEIGQSKN